MLRWVRGYCLATGTAASLRTGDTALLLLLLSRRPAVHRSTHHRKRSTTNCARCCLTPPARRAALRRRQAPLNPPVRSSASAAPCAMQQQHPDRTLFPLQAVSTLSWLSQGSQILPGTCAAGVVTVALHLPTRLCPARGAWTRFWKFPASVCRFCCACHLGCLQAVSDTLSLHSAPSRHAYCCKCKPGYSLKFVVPVTWFCPDCAATVAVHTTATRWSCCCLWWFFTHVAETAVLATAGDDLPANHVALESVSQVNSLQSSYFEGGEDDACGPHADSDGLDEICVPMGEDSGDSVF
jgi:hypothetical protein